MQKVFAQKITKYFVVFTFLLYLASCSHAQKNNSLKPKSNDSEKLTNFEPPSFEKDKRWILQSKSVQDKKLESLQHKKINDNRLKASWSAYKSKDFGRALVFINAALADPNSDIETLKKSNLLKAAILKKLNVSFKTTESKLSQEAVSNQNETIKK